MSVKFDVIVGRAPSAAELTSSSSSPFTIDVSDTFDTLRRLSAAYAKSMGLKQISDTLQYSFMRRWYPLFEESDRDPTLGGRGVRDGDTINVVVYDVRQLAVEKLAEMRERKSLNVGFTTVEFCGRTYLTPFDPQMRYEDFIEALRFVISGGSIPAEELWIKCNWLTTVEYSFGAEEDSTTFPQQYLDFSKCRGQTLAELGLDADFSDFFTFHVCTNGTMELYVKTLAGRTICLRVDPDETVASLHVRVMFSLGGYPDAQRLIFGGKQLEVQRAISAYGINAEKSTLHLVYRLRGG